MACWGQVHTLKLLDDADAQKLAAERGEKGKEAAAPDAAAAGGGTGAGGSSSGALTSFADPSSGPGAFC